MLAAEKILDSLDDILEDKAQFIDQDHTDKTGRFVVTDVKAKKKLKRGVSLEEIKNTPKLSNIALIKQSRLSVMPLKKKEWDIIIKLSQK